MWESTWDKFNALINRIICFHKKNATFYFILNRVIITNKIIST